MRVKGVAWLLCNGRTDTLGWIACGEQTKESGQDHAISRPSGIQIEGLVVLELSLGPFDLLPPRGRCKRERGTADVSREKLNWAPREVPKERATAPAYLPCTGCAVPGPVCQCTGHRLDRGNVGGAMQTMQATLYCTVHQTDQIGG